MKSNAEQAMESGHRHNTKLSATPLTNRTLWQLFFPGILHVPGCLRSNIVPKQCRHDMKAHVDPSGYAGGADDPSIVDESSAWIDSCLGSNLTKQVQRSVVRRHFQPVEQASFCQQ